MLGAVVCLTSRSFRGDISRIAFRIPAVQLSAFHSARWAVRSPAIFSGLLSPAADSKSHKFKDSIHSEYS